MHRGGFSDHNAPILVNRQAVFFRPAKKKFAGQVNVQWEPISFCLVLKLSQVATRGRLRFNFGQRGVSKQKPSSLLQPSLSQQHRHTLLA